MNAIEILTRDHNLIIQLLKQIIATTKRDIAERQKLFAELKKHLSLLETIEEELFYCKLKDHKATSSLVMEACSELHFADDIVQKLSMIPCSNDVWSAGVDVLKENIENHIQKEAQLFEKVPAVLNVDELEELGQRMDAIKRAAENNK